MRLSARIAIAVLAVLLATASACAVAQAPPADEPRAADSQPGWRVVLVRSWDAMFVANVVREQALRSALFADSPRRIEIHSEEVDPMRFPAVNSPSSVELMHRKYEDAAVDLVIASGIDAFEYVTRHRDRVWPGAAVVFYGVPDGFIDRHPLPPRTTGRTVSLDVAGTLEVALALVPKARKAYLVAGIAPFDRMFLAYARKAARRFEGRLDIEEIAGLDRRQTIERVERLDRDDIVLYLTTVQEGDGRYAGPMADIIPLVSRRSRAPVFAAVQSVVGRGPVGASGARFDDHGRDTGQLVRRVLEGADPGALPVTLYPAPVCELDWNALARWDIPESRIPDHCAVLNRPPSIWSLYLGPVIAMLSIILLQAALISAFVIQRRMRRRAEAQLQARAAELEQASRMAMVGELTAGIAHEINQPIGAILGNAEAAQLMLEQGTLDRDKLREILADIRDQDLRAGEVVDSLRNLMARRQFRPVDLDLNLEVAGALEHVVGEAARRNVRLASIYGRGLPPVRGDALQVQQVVINLVHNAIDAVRDLPEAQRSVAIETVPDDGGVEIRVTDHGPGVDAAHAADLFDRRFTTKPHGMGFGLTIVRAIAEMHGGRAFHQPALPQGARFSVWLPAHAP